MSDANRGSPISRPKTRYSMTGKKNDWLKKKDTQDEQSRCNGSALESIADVNTINSMEFLETLNLKSKEKIEQINDSNFNNGNFFAEDSFSTSPISSYRKRKTGNDSGIDEFLQPSVPLSPNSVSESHKESQESLGKTLAFSLQLIAAGDSNILPQSPTLPAETENTTCSTFVGKEAKHENCLDSEDTPVKDQNTPTPGRYKTRSSLSNIDNQSSLSNNTKNQDSIIDFSENLIVSEGTICNTDNHLDSSKEKEFNQKIPKKRGRRKKVIDPCSVQKECTYLCSQCGKSFNKSQTLRQHFITHTDRFACSFCNVRCKSKGDLRSHTQTHTKEKPYRCEVCNTCYTRESILKKHKSTQLHKNACFQLGNQIHLALRGDVTYNENQDAKIYKHSCKQCPKKFLSKQILRQHSKIHNYKFSCPQCHKRCKTALLLKIHKRCHLKQGATSCKFCCRVFSNFHHLREHIRAAHSALFWQNKFPGSLWRTLLTQKVGCFDDLKVEFFQSDDIAGKLVCSICSRNFKSKKAFQKHCEKHKVSKCTTSIAEKNLIDQTSAEKMPQYQCAECPESFIHFEEFIQHHADCHNAKPLVCHICYSQFDCANEFKSHVQNHGPTMLFSGASLEEIKIPRVQKRYKRRAASQYEFVPKESNEKFDKKITKNSALQEDLVDESFMEKFDFMQLISIVLDDTSDKEDSDHDEELYAGIKMLLYDHSQSNTEKEHTIHDIFKKHETNMKYFSVEDSENSFYKCSLCETIFVMASQLHEHMKTHVCIFCDVFCQSKEDLAEHFHCQEKEGVKSEIEKADLDELSEVRSDDITFSSEDEMNEAFLDELEAILDNENKTTQSMDFLSTFSHDEIIRTNKKIFERYSCIDVPTNIYACIICKRKYARPTTLTRHFKTHVCHYCNTFFVDKSDLTDHKYKHRKKAAMIKAEISGETAAKVLHSPMVSKVNRELFKKFTVIDPIRNMNKCCLCDKLFVRKTVLTRHMKTHICSYCDKFYEDKYELARHVSLHKVDSRISEEDNVHRQYPVYDEEKPFISSPAFSSRLEDNGKIVNIGSSYSSTLPQFTATFSAPNTNANETVTFIQIPASETCADPGSVTFDPNVVAEAPSYQIISDPIVQSQGSYMVGPQNCHENNSNKILTLTQDHMVTSDQCQVATPDLFECNLPNKNFYKTGHLKSHMSTHTTPAPFACRYCGKTFIRSGPLRKHEKTQHVKRCDHCDLNFTCQYELDHHMQIHESYTFYK